MKYTAIVSYTVIASVEVEAGNFRDAVKEVRRKYHDGEMDSFVQEERKEKTFNILGLSESEWAEKLAEEKPAEKWQPPTFESLRSFLSGNDVDIGAILVNYRFHELINAARKWAGQPVSKWLMDCFLPYSHDRHTGEVVAWAFNDPSDSWAELEKEWNEQWA